MPDFYARRCAACRRSFESRPIFREDTAYCCAACAANHLCTCLAEVDLADDGVDKLGLAFVATAGSATVNPERRTGSQVPARSR